ncbi:hypothetical protein DFH09DRAFT_1356209, partial [Mycena vulgaris]
MGSQPLWDVAILSQTSTMSSPTKRVFTDETHASRAQASNATHPSTPADLALQLQSVGSRVRKTVMEGYSTHRFASGPPSPTKPPPQAEIFTSANEILRDVYGSAPSHSPISPRKRAREDDSDHEFGNRMAVDTDAERAEDTESDGETVIILDARGTRPVKPRPRRALMQTQSLPNRMFGLRGGPGPLQSTDGPVLETPVESDWSVGGSNISSQPPAFEPMVLSSTPTTLARPAERFPAPPTLSVFNAPTATFLWPNFQASSQMKHGPILYAKYHDKSSSSSSSDSEDSQLGSEDLRRMSSPSSNDRGTIHTPNGPSRPLDEPPFAFSRHEASVEIQPSKTSPVNRLVEPLKSVYILDSERRTSPESSHGSEYASGLFDIGFPPRQDHRTSFAVAPSASVLGSRRPSPSAASSVNSGSDQTSPSDNRSTPNQLPFPPTLNRNWENYAVQIRNPEGGMAYQCTWSTLDGPCHYWSKKQLVKRHVETTHLKFKPFVCDICSKAFPQKTSLEIHRHGHTGDTPHQCIYSC